MNDKTKSPFSELTKQAMKNYEQALQAGLKVQEESSKWWTDFMAQSTTSVDWQKNWKAAAHRSIPIVQKRMEESLRLLEQSSRTSLDLMKEVLAITGSDSPVNTQNKLQDLWEASLEAMRTNATAIAQANSKFAESWMQVFAAGAEAEAATGKAK